LKKKRKQKILEVDFGFPMMIFEVYRPPVEVGRTPTVEWDEAEMSG